VDLAAAGDDGDRARTVAGIDVALEHVSHAGKPFRREATCGHFSPSLVRVWPFTWVVRNRARLLALD
jgi:hypothetical protein